MERGNLQSEGAKITRKINNPNTETSFQIDNATLTFDDTGESSRQDEGKNQISNFKLRDLEVINLGKGEETKEIRIGKLIPPDLKQGLVELLREYADIFTWSYRDMPSLDTAIVEHRLPLIPNAVPILQQLRRMKLEVALRIKEEVEK
ncbi:hypothetical protein CR513_14000, partial [Mucuna pruriens]